jgi:hypothetical protein
MSRSGSVIGSFRWHSWISISIKAGIARDMSRVGIEFSLEMRCSGVCWHRGHTIENNVVENKYSITASLPQSLVIYTRIGFGFGDVVMGTRRMN